MMLAWNETVKTEAVVMEQNQGCFADADQICCSLWFLHQPQGAGNPNTHKIKQLKLGEARNFENHGKDFIFLSQPAASIFLLRAQLFYRII